MNLVTPSSSQTQLANVPDVLFSSANPTVGESAVQGPHRHLETSASSQDLHVVPEQDRARPSTHTRTSVIRHAGPRRSYEWYVNSGTEHRNGTHQQSDSEPLSRLHPSHPLFLVNRVESEWNSTSESQTPQLPQTPQLSTTAPISQPHPISPPANSSHVNNDHSYSLVGHLVAETPRSDVRVTEHSYSLASIGALEAPPHPPPHPHALLRRSNRLSARLGPYGSSNLRLRGQGASDPVPSNATELSRTNVTSSSLETAAADNLRRRRMRPLQSFSISDLLENHIQGHPEHDRRMSSSEHHAPPYPSQLLTQAPAGSNTSAAPGPESSTPTFSGHVTPAADTPPRSDPLAVDSSSGIWIDPFSTHTYVPSFMRPPQPSRLPFPVLVAPSGSLSAMGGGESLFSPQGTAVGGDDYSLQGSEYNRDVGEMVNHGLDYRVGSRVRGQPPTTEGPLSFPVLVAPGGDDDRAPPPPPPPPPLGEGSGDNLVQGGSEYHREAELLNHSMEFIDSMSRMRQNRGQRPRSGSNHSSLSAANSSLFAREVLSRSDGRGPNRTPLPLAEAGMSLPWRRRRERFRPHPSLAELDRHVNELMQLGMEGVASSPRPSRQRRTRHRVPGSETPPTTHSTRHLRSDSNSATDSTLVRNSIPGSSGADSGSSVPVSADGNQTVSIPYQSVTEPSIPTADSDVIVVDSDSDEVTVIINIYSAPI